MSKKWSKIAWFCIVLVTQQPKILPSLYIRRYFGTLWFKIWTTRSILTKRVSHKTTPCFVCMPFLERGEKPIYRNLLREKTPKSYYNHDGYYLSPFMFTQNTFVLTFHILRICTVHSLSSSTQCINQIYPSFY